MLTIASTHPHDTSLGATVMCKRLGRSKGCVRFKHGTCSEPVHVRCDSQCEADAKQGSCGLCPTVTTPRPMGIHP